MAGSESQVQDKDAEEVHSVPVEMVRRAVSGERDAFERLIDRYQGDIFRMIYYRTLSRMDAEDITQDVFIKAYRGVRSLNDPAMFRSWLYRIALNALNDFFRKKRLRSIFSVFSHEQMEEQSMDTGQGPDHLEEKEFRTRLAAFMSRLSSAEKEVFQLRYVDEMGIREIAAVLGRNESTVKTHLYRAVEKFRREKGLDGLLQEEKP